MSRPNLRPHPFKNLTQAIHRAIKENKIIRNLIQGGVLGELLNQFTRTTGVIRILAKIEASFLQGSLGAGCFVSVIHLL